MTLAENIRSLSMSQKRMGFVLHEFRETCEADVNARSEQRLAELLRQIRDMVQTRAALRTRAATALRDHPELVEALAERRVARLYRNTLARMPDPDCTQTAGHAPPTLTDEMKRRQQEARERLAAAELAVERLSVQIRLAGQGHRKSAKETP